MNLLKKLFGKIFVNDNEYDLQSNSTINVSSGRVIIDGVDCTPDLKNITIVVNGDIQNLKIGACKSLQISGNVGKIESSLASVFVTGNSGPIKTSNGNVDIKQNVEGDIETFNGDVTAETINGKVETRNGDIKAKFMNSDISMYKFMSGNISM